MIVADPIEDAEELSIPAGRLRNAFAWVENSGDVSPSLKLAVYATIWLERVASFRQWEDQALATGEYRSQLDRHRAALSELIAEGERLVYIAKRSNASKFPSGFAVADLEATVDSLRISFRCEHGPKNTPEVNNAIAKLFDGAE